MVRNAMYGLLAYAALPVLAQAQATTPATIEEKLAKLEAAAAAAQTAGDNAWMLTSSALVLMMTGPGLALFYGGLVRRKNVLSTMMHSFSLMAVMTVLWAVIGYSLSFGEGSPYIGSLQYVMMNGVGTAPSEYLATVPHLTFMVFQLMFVIITPALISGAFAERVRFSAIVLFMVLWAFIVYFPMAHMVWGKNGLLNAALGGSIPCLDFAGGTVVHITSGVSALVFALFIGKRDGYGKEPMRPHSLVLSTVGACLLWVGWFGFNAGSAGAANGLASSAFVTTHFAAASATLGWVIAEWLKHGKPSMLGAISGCVAGLVAITPGAGFVTPGSALLIGLLGGFFCFYTATIVKNMFGYDDSLDAFGVHGAGGTLGAILTGVFATKAVNPLYGDKAMGLLEGNSQQLVNQLIGTVIAMVLGAVGTYVILVVVNKIVPVRASVEEETEGLDLSMHGEEGYNLEA
ncbi:ammonia channel protein [Bryobacterales bacterium F-183]|nr:ammonia channel protein [Bryobacterales bacterium F-183]